MPRNKPITKLDKLGTLELRPENAVGFYIESKQQEKFFTKPPNWDNTGESLELLVIRSQEECEAMKNLIDEMVRNSQKQAHFKNRKISELYRSLAMVRERFITANAFLRECQEKAESADEKIITQKLLQRSLKSDINTYQRDLNILEKFYDQLTQTVKKMEPYETVIQEVVNTSDIFKSVKDCIARCDALMIAQGEIVELEQEKTKYLEDLRKEMLVVTENASLKILGLTTELGELERSYNAAKTECLKWEKTIEDAKKFIIGNEMIETRVYDAVNQIYDLLCKRQGIEPKMTRNQIEAQLDFINEETQILQEVRKLCKKEMKKTQKKSA